MSCSSQASLSVCFFPELHLLHASHALSSFCVTSFLTCFIMILVFPVVVVLLVSCLELLWYLSFIFRVNPSSVVLVYINLPSKTVIFRFSQIVHKILNCWCFAVSISSSTYRAPLWNSHPIFGKFSTSKHETSCVVGLSDFVFLSFHEKRN